MTDSNEPMDHHRHRGHPLGEKIHQEVDKQVQEPPSMSPNPPALSEDQAEDREETDSDDYGEEDWDPHAGTKPSQIGGEVSDEYWDLEDDPGEAENEDFTTLMVEMLSDLEDVDPRDCEWKPKHKPKKKTVKNGQFFTRH